MPAAKPGITKIYVPDRLGDGGNISQVKGSLSNEGESQRSEAVNVPVKEGCGTL